MVNIFPHIAWKCRLSDSTTIRIFQTIGAYENKWLFWNFHALF